MKILLCVDRSENALAAVGIGGQLASALRADATLLVAGKRPRRVRRALAEAVRLLNAYGVTPKTLIRQGPAIDHFLKETQTYAYDLIVVGYRKRSALEKALNGCVAARVAHRSTTSILIVREGRRQIRKLLVGIGGSGFTTELAQWAARIAGAVGAQVTLIHVEATPPLMYAGLEEVHQTLSELMETDTQSAHALQQAVAIMNHAGVPADIKLAHGVAERELLRTAQDGDYDLIIVGSSWARPTLDRVLLSNVTQDVLLQTRRPVLVVYPEQDGGEPS